MTRPTALVLIIAVLAACASYAIGTYVSHLAQWLFIIPATASGCVTGWWAGGILYPRRPK